MGAVTTLPWGRALTRDDLESMRHQLAVTRLLRLLNDACTPDLIALPAPFDVVLADRTVLQPDVLLARESDLTPRDLPAAPVLAVEVLSPSSRSIDQVLKYARYAEAGVEHYWIIDPDEHALTAYRRRPDGSYEQVGRAIGDEPYEAAEPLPVTIIPSALVPT